MPEIAFIMGKSASGKDKIYKNLIEDESLKLNTVILYTTRPMRAGEKEGVEYYCLFMTAHSRQYLLIIQLLN